MSVSRDVWSDLWLLRQPWTEPPGDPLAVSELSEAERSRADAFHRAHDRLLYLTAHIALRRLLASYLGIAPREVDLVREPCPGCGEPHGRPAVAGDPPPLHYSLSHSSGLALFGVAAVPIGVDVEKVPSGETVQLCLPALHQAEQSELEESGPEERRSEFARLWTRKEAYLKGIGTGLARDLGKDYLGESGGAVNDPPGWTVRNVPCGSSHVNHVAAAALSVDDARPARIGWLPADFLFAGSVPDLELVRGA
ncbi:4'-phosphopantetheinyl transferase family protein [Actinopolyspora halophila]|uniref:4'-phosphopantetheinyl transferase family protein n=1 Tax=Actinopolyspora halophila TaxID=1850 RepID=UPI0012FA9913|nr:4'-phosphopantetheinyl transferase superfamily protein [Actinopolyspora halophila]